MIQYFDCHGDFPSLGANMFKIKINSEYDTIIAVNMGLEEVELLMGGRFRAKKLGVLVNYD